MLPVPEHLVRQITQLQRDTVVGWHAAAPDYRYKGLLAIVCEQHQFNYQLWHEEDIARSPDVSDARIAEVKRSIDRYNQQRNDAIERVDEALIQLLAAAGVLPRADARLNTETPGSAIDRLSIMALRIYHFEEQLQRDDTDDSHRAKVADRLSRCRAQHIDLSQAVSELFEDLWSGRKQLKAYRQMKMYNDPTLNPYLYQSRRLAG